MGEFQRPPEAFPFIFAGIKTNVRADVMAPDKYPYAKNIRAYDQKAVTSRPAIRSLFSIAELVEQMRTYVRLGTDDQPRLLAKGTSGKVYLDTAAIVDTGYAPGSGCAMIPYRPNQSPQSWMYIGDSAQYRKLSAPSATNVVTAQKVGIAEPQAAPEACPDQFAYNDFTGLVGSWAAAGTAGGLTGSATLRGVNVISKIVFDPATPGTRASLGLITSGGVIVNQGRGELILLDTGGGGSTAAVIEDVIPPIPAGLTAVDIQYFSGTTGRCIIVPSTFNVGEGIPEFTQDGIEATSILQQARMAGLRRGAIISVGAETGCFVLSVTTGPNNTICIETSTTLNHSAGETINTPYLSTIVVGSANPLSASLDAHSPGIHFTATAGTATITQTLGTSPFAATLPGSHPQSVQEDDYLHISVMINTIANLVEGRIIFDIEDGSFTKQGYYWAFRQNDLQQASVGTVTQLAGQQSAEQRAEIDMLAILAGQNSAGSTSSQQLAAGDAQWSELWIPIRELTRFGAGSRTLADCTAVRISVQASGNLDCSISGLWVGGGGQCDIGQVGMPMFYRYRGRSSVTGARSNPSPATRYGVNPRRQFVEVTVPLTAPDPQIDTWDIFRLGGSLNKWTYVGSVTVGSTAVFLDDYSDTAIITNEQLDFARLLDYEPWPTIDLPYNDTVNVCGTRVITTTLTTTSNPNVLRWLPGNLLKIGQQVYTLRTRPVLIGTLIHAIVFDLVENAGSATNIPVSIYEPAMAAQPLPYLWGPSGDGGVVFGCGDPLRPGTVYFSKNFSPDSTSDRYNLELTPPSEPLLGGEVLEGKSFVASSDRWWALYAAFTTARRFTPVEQPVGRGLAAPYGHCTDGKLIYFWAKDGIYAHSGGIGLSLTDDDLYNIFPHEGIQGENILYAGQTIYAPDYRYAADFRLAIHRGFLYADYRDLNGDYRTLTYDIQRRGWVIDDYGAGMDECCIHYSPEQQVGPVLVSGAALYPDLYIGQVSGQISQQHQNTDAIGTVTIPCVICTPEWNGGSIRAQELWGDVALDLVPAGALMGADFVTMGQFVIGGSAIPITQSNLRDPDVILDIPGTDGVEGGGFYAQSLGIILVWSEWRFATLQTRSTVLNAWMPTRVDKPDVTAQRAQDWDDAGTPAAKFVQGFILEADTFGQDKLVSVRDAETKSLHSTFTVNHSGQSKKPYSFAAPFIAHLVRIEPQDAVAWRMFNVQWVYQPTPESTLVWQTQPTSHGLTGFMHVQRMTVAHASTTDLTLTVIVDGVALPSLTIPNSAGIYQKTLIVLPTNKGRLISYRLESTSAFQVWENDMEVWVGQWGRQGGYQNYPLIGGVRGDRAAI